MMAAANPPAPRVSPSVTFQTAPLRGHYADWFWRFLRRELAPYPGRFSVVARMVLSATLVMIAIMTFHIPGAALGAYYTLVIPRDSPRSSFKAALISICAFAIGTVYVVLGVMLFVDSPVTHFLWVVASLFLCFFVLSITSVYNAATGFGFLIAIAIPLWDRAGPTQVKLAGTLFTFLSVAMGCVIAVAVEYFAAAFTHSGDRILDALTSRMETVEQLLASYERQQPPDERVVSRLEQYATIGTGGLRQILGQSRYEQAYLGELGAAIALTGRLTDLAAVTTESRRTAESADIERLRMMRHRIRQLRIKLHRQQVPDRFDIQPMPAASPSLPLLPEMERCITLISQAFAGEPIDEHLPTAGEGKAAPLFARDAFTSTKHVKFAIRGCLASTACYMFYTGVDWPGINTSIATCIVTAFSTIGASRQKQVLRVSGALIGGVILGLGSQVFILPNLDSITGFTLLFASVSLIASWIATSSPRLSYAGLQLALAYYLINLSEFNFNYRLSVARDRFVGVMLGLIAMWLIFDQLGARLSADTMRTAFLTNLRRIARFGLLPPQNLSFRQIAALWEERNIINKGFNDVRSQADAVLFEFRKQRADDLLARQHVRAWQPELRTIFLIKLALLQHRLRTGSFDLQPLAKEVNEHASALLDASADYIEGKPESTFASFTAESAHLQQQLEQGGLSDPALALAHSLLLLVRSFVYNLLFENVPLAHSRRANTAASLPN